jgi:hypothetical protein
LNVFWQLWEAAAIHAKDAGRHLLLLVDGLDEDRRAAEGPSVAGALPTQSLGTHARVLVASRPSTVSALPNDVDATHPLRWPRTVVQLSASKPAETIRDLAEQEIRALLPTDPMSPTWSSLPFKILGTLTAAVGP